MSTVPPRRWLYPLLGAITTLLGGGAYAFSVFVRPLEAEFAWTRPQTVLAFSVCMFVFGVAMFAGGAAVDRLGPRIPFAAGALCMVAAKLLAARVNTIGELVLTYGVLLGAGIGLTYTASTVALCSRWFPEARYRGLAIGTAVFGFGIGAAVAGPLWSAGITEHGWRTTYTWTGLAYAGVLLPIALLIRFPRPGEVGGGVSPGASAGGLRFAQAVRTRQLWVLGGVFFLTISGALMVTSQLAALVQVAPPRGPGLTAALAAGVITVLAVCNGFGRPLWGWISGRLGPRTCLVVCPCLMAIALLGLALALPAGGRVGVTLSVALLGLAFGGALALNPIMASAVFGPAYVARIYGLIFLLGFSFGGFLGPQIGARIRALSDSETPALYAGAAAALAAAVLAALFLPRVPVAPPAQPAKTS